MHDVRDVAPVVRVSLPTPQLKALCPVVVESDLYGEHAGLVRNINSAGAFLETHDHLPLGASVRIRFGAGDATIVAHGVVRQHCALNYADAQGPNALSGMTVRFTGFEPGKPDESFH